MNILPLTDDRWPPSCESLRAGFAGQLNVYRTMAHHPELLVAWAPLRDHVVVNNSLGTLFSEIVILRTGVRLGSSYEWAHHVSRSRACGLSDARISSIAGPLSAMDEADSILAGAVDELMTVHELSSKKKEELLNLIGTAGIFDLMATVGFYSTLGFILKSFGTPVDDKIADEMQHRPLK